MVCQTGLSAALTGVWAGAEHAADAMSLVTDLSEGSRGAHFWKEEDIWGRRGRRDNTRVTDLAVLICSSLAVSVGCTFSAAVDIPFSEDRMHSLVVFSFCTSQSRRLSSVKHKGGHFVMGGASPVSISAAGIPLLL